MFLLKTLIVLTTIAVILDGLYLTLGNYTATSAAAYRNVSNLHWDIGLAVVVYGMLALLMSIVPSKVFGSCATLWAGVFCFTASFIPICLSIAIYLIPIVNDNKPEANPAANNTGTSSSPGPPPSGNPITLGEPDEEAWDAAELFSGGEDEKIISSYQLQKLVTVASAMLNGILLGFQSVVLEYSAIK